MKRTKRRRTRLDSARLPRPGRQAPVLSAPEPEAFDRHLPVNPYSLLLAINEASSLARTTWLASLAVMAWLFIAIAGVKHKDLLMGSGVALPLLQVEIDIQRLFIFAPLIVLLLMFGVLIQHALLARRLYEFDGAVRREEGLRERAHPLRLELDGYFLTQLLAGPDRAGVIARLQSAMSWISLVVLPVSLLLAIQIVFLPYRDQVITMGHRTALVAYVILIAVLGVFIVRPAKSYGAALRWIADHRAFGFLSTGSLLAAALVYAFTFATVKDGFLDRNVGAGLDGFFRNPWFDAAGLRPPRTLYLRGQDLVKDSEDASNEISIDLRDRDLQFADFEGADLHRAQFAGARLDGAKMTGADLRKARFGCTTDFERQTASEAKPCVSLRGVDLQGANLKDAVFDHADLTGATLTIEALAEAKVRQSFMAQATLYSAPAKSASPSPIDMAGWYLPGANLISVDLKDAKLAGAKLAGARLTRSRLIGADLTDADLNGADLTEADLTGAILTGADLTGARLEGAKLDGARISDLQLRAAAVARK